MTMLTPPFHLRSKIVHRTVRTFRIIAIIGILVNVAYGIDDTTNTEAFSEASIDRLYGGQFHTIKYKPTVPVNFCPSPCSCLNDYFECKKQNLKEVPPLPEWVRSLVLTGNKLDDSIEGILGNLTSLEILNLKKNQLQNIPIFVGLPSLEKLNLANNRIQSVTKEALQALPKLKELDLMKNRIKMISIDSFPAINELNILNLNGNHIEFLKNGVFDHLNHLNELHLSHNNLKDLPHDIFKMLSVLKKLDMSNNHLNVSWAIFKGLEKLRILKLRSNGIEHLTDGVFEALKSIAVIELDSNRIAKLSRGGFFNLVTLTTLSLANNTIKSFEPDAWEFVQQLVSLDLSLNNLTEIPRNGFTCLSKLKKLHLQFNQIKFIDDSGFSCFSNLEYLDLSGNRLSWTIEGTSGPFSQLKRLHKLELKYNDVKSINKKAFLGLDNLEYLNLNGNNITTIQFNAFEPLRHLNHLIINSTHFLCDCNLQWLPGWLMAQFEQQTNDLGIICDYPDEFRGRHLTTLREDKDFMCNESPKPRLIKEPSNQLAIKGTNVTLECSAISSVSEPMTFQWRRDNIDFKANESETRTQHLNNITIASSFLHLSNVNREHNGKYQCVVSNSFGSAYSQRIKVTAASYPGFQRTPTNVTLSAGSTARLDCSAYGEPMPQIAWQKDGGNDFPAARERRMHVMTTDDAFFIMNAKPVDMGVYTCTAENPAGIIKANATLIVHELPTFQKDTETNLNIVVGKSFVLDCFVGGSPRPELFWFKDGKLLRSNGKRLFFGADRQLFIVLDAIEQDAGSYTCKIRNDLGSAERHLLVKISKSVSKAIMNGDEMTGIIVITIFCCTAATSIIWVVIICHTRKSNDCNNGGNLTTNGLSRQINQSMNLQSRFLIQQEQQASVDGTADGGVSEITLGTFYHMNNGNLQPHENDDCISSKDSGTGDSAKRSRSGDDINLNDSYSNCSNNQIDSYELSTFNQKQQQQQQHTIPLIRSSQGQLKAQSLVDEIPTTISDNNTMMNQIRHSRDRELNASNRSMVVVVDCCPNSSVEQAVPLIDNVNRQFIYDCHVNHNSSISPLSKLSGNRQASCNNGTETSVST